MDFISEALNLQDAIQEADIVITGEGSFDDQTAAGKVVSKVYELGQLSGRQRDSMIILCGRDLTKHYKPDALVWNLTERYGEADARQRTAQCIEQLLKEELPYF